MRLRSLSLNFCKLCHFIPVQTLCIVYLSLYQAIFQYDLVIRGRLADNAIHPLVTQQKQFIRVCLRKFIFEGSSSINFITFNVIPVKLLFKKILFLLKNKNFLASSNNECRYTKKRIREHNI